MMEHELKTHPEYFQAIKRGDKPFEIRIDDRPYAVGDTLLLREWEPIIARCTGDVLRVPVIYVMRGGPWLPLGYIAMGIRPTELEAELDRLRAENSRLCADVMQLEHERDTADTYASEMEWHRWAAEKERDELRAQLSRALPDGFATLDAYIRTLNDENSLFTYQSAERGFLLRDMLASGAAHQGWVRLEAFSTRLRTVLDNPEGAEARGRAESAAARAALAARAGAGGDK
jgi:hypothetical protein